MLAQSKRNFKNHHLNGHLFQPTKSTLSKVSHIQILRCGPSSNRPPLLLPNQIQLFEAKLLKTKSCQQRSRHWSSYLHSNVSLVHHQRQEIIDIETRVDRSSWKIGGRCTEYRPNDDAIDTDWSTVETFFSPPIFNEKVKADRREEEGERREGREGREEFGERRDVSRSLYKVTGFWFSAGFIAGPRSTRKRVLIVRLKWNLGEERVRNRDWRAVMRRGWDGFAPDSTRCPPIYSRIRPIDRGFAFRETCFQRVNFGNGAIHRVSTRPRRGGSSC